MLCTFFHKSLTKLLNVENSQATLLEIVLKFRNCNECQLMRFVLQLELERYIYLKQGIFRVSARGGEALQ